MLFLAAVGIVGNLLFVVGLSLILVVESWLLIVGCYIAGGCSWFLVVGVSVVTGPV